MQKVLYLLGTDGVGKSSFCEALRSRVSNEEWLIVERSNCPGLALESIRERLQAINQTSLEAIGPDDFPLDLSPSHTENDQSHFYLLLDAEDEVLRQRMNERGPRVICEEGFESPRGLFYYRQRFLEMAAYYGWPVLRTDRLDFEGTLKGLLELMDRPDLFTWHRQLAACDLCSLNIEALDSRNPELEAMLTDPQMTTVHLIDLITENLSNSEWPNMIFLLLNHLRNPSSDSALSICLRQRLASLWLAIRDDQQIPSSTSNLGSSSSGLVYHIEGESKKVWVPRFPWLPGHSTASSETLSTLLRSDWCVIQLKPTIYSHSRQNTGEIEGLNAIRAEGTCYFLEMCRRNMIPHAYRCVVPRHSVVIAQFIQPIPPSEVVVKVRCVGTDFYQYVGLRDTPELVNPAGDASFIHGPYVRFDWRNPNHLWQDSRDPSRRLPLPQALKGYWEMQTLLSNVVLFDVLKKSPTPPVPKGDVVISPELLRGIQDDRQCRASVLSLFHVFQHYMQQVGLSILDGCFMFDRTGTMCYSEPNQDCMRIQLSDGSSSFDKDLWRTGGSASAERIKDKWSALNTRLRDHFSAHPFHLTEMTQVTLVDVPWLQKFCGAGGSSPSQKEEYDTPHSREWRHLVECRRDLTVLGPSRRRRVLITLDVLDGKPTLVKSGTFWCHHSDASIQKAMERASLFPDVLVVNLDAAISQELEGKETVTRDIQRRLATEHFVHVGGGIRTPEIAFSLLDASARRLVISTQARDLIPCLPADRVILELSIDQEQRILTHGRQQTDHWTWDQWMTWVSLNKIEALSVTFHSTEGHLQGFPRDQVRKLVSSVPECVEKIFLGGGIATLEDLEFCWYWPRVIPTLGSAFWTRRLSSSDLICAMCHFSPDRQIPVDLEDVATSSSLGQRLMSETQLRRFIEEPQAVIPGFQLIQVTHNHNSTALLCSGRVIGQGMLQALSTFSPQTSLKCTLGHLIQRFGRALERPCDPDFQPAQWTSQLDRLACARLQRDTPLTTLMLMFRQQWKIFYASDAGSRSSPALLDSLTDMMILIMTLISWKGLSLEAVCQEINARLWRPDRPRGAMRLSFSIGRGQVTLGTPPRNIRLLVPAQKYTQLCVDFARDQMGLELKWPDSSSRDLRIEARVIDVFRFTSCFPDLGLHTSLLTVPVVTAIPVRPKDMPSLLISGLADGALSYQTVMDNQPPSYSSCHPSCEVTDLHLSLLRRSDTPSFRDFVTQNPHSQITVISEHPRHLHQWVRQQEIIDPSKLIIMEVSGASEAFLVNCPGVMFCDAIVHTGSTLSANHLVEDSVILPSLTLALYRPLNL